MSRNKAEGISGKAGPERRRLWQITLPDGRKGEFQGAVKLEACQEAHRFWGLPWTWIARSADIEELEHGKGG